MNKTIVARLRAVSIFEDEDVVSKNMAAILKNQIVLQNENLNFIFKQFESNKATFDRFIDSINVFVEKEIGYIFDQLFADCTLQDAKQMSKNDRESGDVRSFPSAIGGDKKSSSSNDSAVTEAEVEVPKPKNKPKRMEMSLTYGEIEYKSFYNIMRKLDLSNHIPGRDARGLVFYDLGSGTARAVIVARIMYSFRCCKGIELLLSLHRGGKAVVNKFYEHYTQIMSDVTANIDLSVIGNALTEEVAAGAETTEPVTPAVVAERTDAVVHTNAAADRSSIELIHGSITDTAPQEGVPRWWEDGDVVFANSTCFDSTLMEQISVLAGKLRPGSIIITFTKSLNYTTSQQYNTATEDCAAGEYQDGVPLPLSNLQVKTVSPFGDSPLSDDYEGENIRNLRNVPPPPPPSIGCAGGMSSMIDDMYPDSSRGGAVKLTALSEPVYMFELVEKTRYKMSWGPATVFIHRRLGTPVVSPADTSAKGEVNAVGSSSAGEPTSPYCLSRWRKNCTEPVRVAVSTALGCTPVAAAANPEGIVRAAAAAASPRVRNMGSVGGACDSDEDCEGDGVVDGVEDASNGAGGSTADAGALTPGTLTPGHYVESRFTLPHAPGAGSGATVPQVLKFMLYVPSTYRAENYTDASLLVYLHGASCRGKSFEFHRSKGLMQYLQPCSVPPAATGNGRQPDEWDLLYSDKVAASEAEGVSGCVKSVAQLAVENSNCLVLAPLCPSGFEWKSEHVTKLVIGCVESLLGNLFLSKSRLYCSGNSMGGLGCWMLAARYPQLFRAAVPICGGGNAIYACLLVHLPM